MDEPAAPYFDEPIRESLRQPFRLQRVFARSFSAFGRNIFSFLLLGAIVYSPVILYTFVVLTDEQAFLNAVESWDMVLVMSNMPLSLILSAAVIYGTFRQLRGEPTSVGRSIGVGMTRLFPVLGVGVLLVLIIGAGFLALVIPGIIAYCVFWVAVPVAVVERPGVLESLRRSRELTRGDRLPIFGIVLLLGLIGGLSNYVLERVLLADPTITSLKTYVVLSLVWTVVLGVFGAVVNAVGYHDLRAAKETVDLEELASVFG